MNAAPPSSNSVHDGIYRRLLARIQRKYPTTTEDLDLGGVTLRFTRVADPNRVLDEVAAEEDRREKISPIRLPEPQHLPYWAELWESALGIAAVVTKMKFTPSTRVLDLGCGMGLAGAAAAAMGAEVMLVDLETPALLFAKLNCLPLRRRVRIRQLNWQADRLNEQFDLILGADILYDRKQWKFLDEFFKAHLAKEGSVLLGEPGRQSGDLFVPWIAQRGWNLREGSQLARPQGKAIRVFSLTRV
ncbi:MAG: methyltransferase [Tepidisphaeraceae bacterium]